MNVLDIGPTTQTMLELDRNVDNYHAAATFSTTKGRSQQFIGVYGGPTNKHFATNR
jgi:hypothetical protein